MSLITLPVWFLGAASHTIAIETSQRWILAGQPW
jgi:hypothetical protein